MSSPTIPDEADCPLTAGIGQRPTPHPHATGHTPPPRDWRRIIARLGARIGLSLMLLNPPALHAGTSTETLQPAPPTLALRVLSLNAEHLMSRHRFRRWQAICGAHHWQAPPEGQRPPELTYCDALNGRNARGQLVHGPLRHDRDLTAKVRQLRQLIRQASPDILLLQEVSDRQAVQSLLDEGWAIHTSEEYWRGTPMPQHVAIAWRRARFPIQPQVALIDSISQRTETGHQTRPGLSALIDLGPALRLSILNVHLKAGCRLGRLERSSSRQPTRYWRRRDACRTLQAQIPPLEAWLDAQILAGRQVLITGDFNRDLRSERKAGLPARADGSPAGSPIGPDSEAGSSRISSLLAELDDDVPPGSRLHLVASGPYRKRADCHRHITPFLLSRGLAPFLTDSLDALRVQVIPFAEPVSLNQPRPSDHCPHLLVLPLTRLPSEAVTDQAMHPR
ncbi:MAG: endonuclease/exonuclease/phosphatase family protein [Lautropia sp.]|nr:endonuclease/exonuclease/phosphatase family protein [Lautropia sp.]